MKDNGEARSKLIPETFRSMLNRIIALYEILAYSKMIGNLGLFDFFVPGGSPTCFGLGRVPITPPGPAMIRMGRSDQNSNKTKQKDNRRMLR